jgi:hypothetical protein
MVSELSRDIELWGVLTNATASSSGKRSLFVKVRSIDVESSGNDNLVGRVQASTASVKDWRISQYYCRSVAENPLLTCPKRKRGRNSSRI